MSNSDSKQVITDAKQLGQRIRSGRKAAGLTQAKLAALCEVGVRFLSDLENGKQTAHIGKTLQVLGGLGLDLYVMPRAQRAALGSKVAASKLVQKVPSLSHMTASNLDSLKSAASGFDALKSATSGVDALSSAVSSAPSPFKVLDDYKKTLDVFKQLQDVNTQMQRSAAKYSGYRSIWKDIADKSAVSQISNFYSDLSDSTSDSYKLFDPDKSDD